MGQFMCVGQLYLARVDYFVDVSKRAVVLLFCI